MAVHFTTGELASRRERAAAELGARGLAGLLVFRQESMYYLTGYDTFGFCFFQCLYLGADGALTLLTRAPDLRQARHTSVIEDIRIWVDGAGAEPARELADIVVEHAGRGARLGVELEAYGLTARSWLRVQAALEGTCTLEDASDLVSALRAVKSPAEMEYVRRAAELADDALDAATDLTGPGAWEGDILAALHGAVLRGGGDEPANEIIIGSGRDALLCRSFSGRRHLGERDQLTLELAGVYRHYHACLMRTLLVGPVDAAHRALHGAAREALEATEAALRPGRTLGEAFAEHARVLDEAGYGEHRLNACGYSLGATFAPTWMDGMMLYADNPTVVTPGMVIFVHMILMDSTSGRAMTLGETVEITPAGCRALSRHGRELIER